MNTSSKLLVSCLFCLALSLVSGCGSSGGNPLKNAKQGDWIRYDVTFTVKDDNVHENKYIALFEVLSNDGKKVELQITLESGYGSYERITTINLSDYRKEISQLVQEKLLTLFPFPMTADDVETDIETERSQKTTKETILVAGNDYDCVVSTITTTLTGDTDASITVVSKVWTSQAIPITGVVKAESKTMYVTKRETLRGTLTSSFAASGKGKRKPPKNDKKEGDIDEAHRASEFDSNRDGQTLPSDLPKLYPTQIEVYADGEKLEGAVVTLYPIGGGEPVGGTTESNGIAKLSTRVQYAGAPVGKYKVCVIKNLIIEGPTSQQPAPTDPKELDKYKQKVFGERKVESVLAPEYRESKSTPLEVEVVEGKNRFSVEVKKLVSGR